MGNGNSSQTILSNNDSTSLSSFKSFDCRNSLHSNSHRSAEGSFEVSMGNWKENNGRTDVWGVEYKTGKPNRRCTFRLTANHADNIGTVHAIHFGVNDSADDNNKTDISLDITKAGRDGLRGGTISIETNSASPFTRRTRQQDFSISTETTIVSYGGGSSFREGLFVVEKKRKVNSENAYMVTLAHYYVTKDVGLSIVVKISRKGNGFVVEVEGPVKHPSADLRNVLVETCRNGIWSPAACSHCNTDNTLSHLKEESTQSHARTSFGNHRFSSHFDPFPSFHGGSHFSSFPSFPFPIFHRPSYPSFFSRPLLSHSPSLLGFIQYPNMLSNNHNPFFPIDSNNKDPQMFLSQHTPQTSNQGLINSSGSTDGVLNHCVIFIGCTFEKS